MSKYTSNPEGDLITRLEFKIGALESDLARLRDDLQLACENNAMHVREYRSLREENTRLREALKWYADPENYDENGAPTKVITGEPTAARLESDDGDVARATLAPREQQPEPDDDEPDDPRACNCQWDRFTEDGTQHHDASCPSIVGPEPAAAEAGGEE